MFISDLSLESREEELRKNARVEPQMYSKRAFCVRHTDRNRI